MYKIKITNIGLWGLLFSALVFTNCSDVFEKDLKGKSMNVLLPMDSLVSSSSYVEFKWDAIDGADYYHLEIVSPKFDSLLAYIVDSNLMGVNFEYNFNPGNYEWRLRAENSISESKYKYGVIRIDSNIDLSGDKVIIYKPKNNSYTSDSLIKFQWSDLYNAENYNLIIKDTLNLALLNENYVDNIVYVNKNNFLGYEGQLNFSITAMNQYSFSQAAESKFYFDETPPQSNIIKPSKHDTFATDSIINFEWETFDNVSKVFTDTLIIKSKNGSYIKYRQKVHNGSASLTDSINSEGDYYGIIKSYDKANNKHTNPDTLYININNTY